MCKFIGNKLFLSKEGVKEGQDPKWEHGAENKNGCFGLREVKRLKVNVINFKRTYVDENCGGIVNGVKYCSFYRMNIL